MKYPAFIILIALLFSCTSKSKVEEQNTSQSSTQSEENISEDFKTFYAKFLTDESFQLSRISFPLDGEIIEEEIEVSPIQKNDWNMIRGSVYEVDRNEYKVEIEEDSTQVHHRVYIEDSGIDIDMKYKRIDGKWHLIYYKSIFI